MRQLTNNLMSVISSYKVLDGAHDWLYRFKHGFSFLGYESSPSDLSLSQRSFDRMCARFCGLYEQGASFSRLTNYVRLWIKWARSGVSLDIEKLKLKTTQILQNTFHVQVPLKSS